MKSNRAQAEIDVFASGGLLEQLGSDVQAIPKARQLLRRWQKLVRAAWPGCPNELGPDGNVFIVRPADAVPMQYDTRLKGRIGRWDQSGSPFDLPLLREVEEGESPRDGEKPVD